MTLPRTGFFALLLLFVATVALSQNTQPADPKKKVTLRRGAPHGATAGHKAASNLASSIDAGDRYESGKSQRKLLRLAGAVALQTDAGRTELSSPGKPLADFATGPKSGKITIFSAPEAVKREQLQQPGKLASLLQSIRATEAGKTANPVFIDPKSGLRLIATSELLVALKPGTDAQQFFGADWLRTEPLWGTTDQFVLRLPGATAEGVLGAASDYAMRPGAEWAEPNFLSQVERQFTPNDPLFIYQWGLNNTGQFGGNTNAHVHAAAAWDLTTGNSNVVIAIMDDGVQIDHPDLAANIFQNPGEVDNGLDDDGNGFIDDFRGWDFFANDNNPSPVHDFDIHGTALAGVVAGVAENGFGISGTAPGCRIMPLKIITGDGFISNSVMSRVLHYAAGLNQQGQSVWRGADIINISLLFGQSFAVDSALRMAATKGRGGKGCAIFCASGNSAGAWVPFEVEFEEAGTYTLRWEYTKDFSDEFATGADTVWLDNIVFPNGIVESFESGLPPGWTTGGHAPWQSVVDGVAGDHALTGWNGPGSRSLRAGRIEHNQRSFLEVTTFVDDFVTGVLRFWVWTESEAGDIGRGYEGFDVFHFYVGPPGYPTNEIDFDFGVPLLETRVAYPASHSSVFAVGASTDFDYRADYSQFGAALDFVAPSDGGNAAITTTDRTGAAGYNDLDSPDGDFAYDFGGTSSAAPLAAGVAALALSVNPYLTVPDLRGLLTSTCDHIGNVFYDDNGFNPFYGHGRLNAERVVKRARPNLIVTASAAPNPVVIDDPLTYTVSVRNNGTAVSGPVSVTVETPSGAGLGSITPAPSSRNGNVLLFSRGSMPSGSLQTLRITITNFAAGENAFTATAATDIPESVTTDNSVTLQTTSVPVPLISISDAMVTETDSTSTNALFTVSLSNPSSRTVTVRYAAASGAATRGRDFATARGLVRFAPGETSKVISVRVLPDRLDEDDENFFVNLTVPVNATIARDQGIGRIFDNDPLPSISVADTAGTEGNTATAAAVFRVRLSAPSGRPVSAQFQTGPGSALEGLDFTRTNGVLVFAPGRTLLIIPVRIVGDVIQEPEEFFFLRLSDPTVATISDNEAACVIRNNDPAPRLYISDAEVAEGDAGETNAVFNVRLAPASGLEVRVSFATTNGSADGLDFTATSGTLVFAPGETNQPISIPVIGDVSSESNEVFSVRLSAPTNAVIRDVLGRGTILDNDSPALRAARR